MHTFSNLCKPTKCIPFQIYVLIQFLVSSTCFEHLLFIIRRTILYMQLYMLCVHAEITVRGYIIKCLNCKMLPYFLKIKFTFLNV